MITEDKWTGGYGITKTCDFLKDVDVHMIRQVTIEIEGDNPEQITFNIILGSNAPPIQHVYKNGPSRPNHMVRFQKPWISTTSFQ